MTDIGGLARQQWLERGLAEVRKYIGKNGYEVPANVRVSWGFPKGQHGKGRAIGQCWLSKASADEHHEIFISPELGQQRKIGGKKAGLSAISARILDVMAHECGHALLPEKVGHRKPFAKFCEAIGLDGKVTATVAGPRFIEFANDVVEKLGPFPAGRLDLELKVGKQSTRLLKAECAECGYVVRVTKKWVEEAGAPHCGHKSHGRMICDVPDEDEEDGE